MPAFANLTIDAERITQIANATYDWLIAPRTSPKETFDEYKDRLLRQAPRENWSRTGTMAAMNCAVRLAVGPKTLQPNGTLAGYSVVVLPAVGPSIDLTFDWRSGLSLGGGANDKQYTFNGAEPANTVKRGDSMGWQCDLGAPCICAVEGTPHGELAKLSKHTIAAFSSLIKARVVDVVKDISSDAADELTVSKLRELVREVVQEELKKSPSGKQGTAASARALEKEIFDRAQGAADAVAVKYAAMLADATPKLRAKVRDRLLCDPKAAPTTCNDEVDPHLAMSLSKELIDEVKRNLAHAASER